jgi:excisionase family DNA binding protein
MRHSEFDTIIPTDQDAVRAGEVRRALEQGAVDRPLRVQVAAAGQETTTAELPPIVARLLLDILKETAAGHAVSVVPADTDVTSQQAADILNVSRPHVVALVEKGALPARMVGNQRRLPLSEVLAYKAANRAKRRQTLRDLASHDQHLRLE